MIKSLAGIMHLTGLTRISATGNKISSLDFSDAEWSVVSLSSSGVHTLTFRPKLETLELSDNRISKISGLDRLTGLREIVLGE